MQLTMMVKSVNPSSHGQYKKYKKKVWIKNNEDDEVEIEIEVFDIEIINELLLLYDKKGNLIIKEKKEKQQINLLV